MLEKLIKIANQLDQAGLTKEADEFDELIKRYAQGLEGPPIEPIIDGIKKTLHERVDKEIEKLQILAYSIPENYRDTKSAWLYYNLYQNPITITYPSKK